MLKFNNGKGVIVCNKCKTIIVNNCTLMTKKAWKRHSVKRHYCGYCIQVRIGAEK